MKNVQKGFTLIELMIVVAIIAILAAIAIPQYQTYVIRSQVTRAMAEAGDIKVIVEDCINNGKDSTTACDLSSVGASDILTDAAQGGQTNTPAESGYPKVEFTDTAGGATITANIGNHASAKVNGGSVVWTRTDDGAWSCQSDSSKVGTKYAPASCPAASGGGTSGT
jgi:type IV pilus assembly protein PilA